MILKNRILILLSCLFTWIWASADPINTTIGGGSICPGDEIVIPITISNCNNVAAISLTLNFDNTKVSYQGYQNLNSAVSTMFVNQSGGMIYMTWANVSAVNVDDGTLLELRFTGVTGSTNLNWSTSVCEYSDAAGTILPANYYNGSVNVYAVPSISSHPLNHTLVEGQSTTFEVTASGQGLNYQWQVKTPFTTEWENLTSSGNHNNVNSWRLNVNNVGLEMDGNQYRCVVIGTCPSPVISDIGVLTVNAYIPPIPTIVTSIGSASTCPNETFSLPVTVTNCNNVGAISLSLNYNSNLVTYLGYEGTHEQLSYGSIRVNATQGTVYVTWVSANHAISIGDGTLITFVFKSGSGNSSLSWNAAQCEYATLTGGILPTSYSGGSITTYNPPSITSDPVDRSVTEGNNTSFSVSASGQGLSYQWQMSQDQGISWETLSNGGHYRNVTSRTLSVNNVELSMEGLRYRCIVNGTCEPSITSNYGTLHVTSLIPTIVTTAGSLNTCSQTEFGIPISVTNCNNVGAISLELSYNTNVLTYSGYEGVNPALGNGQLQVNASNGTVFIAWASTAGANVGNANLITLNFTALSGNSVLSWNSANCEYAAPGGMMFQTSYNNGSVTVGDMSFSITSQPSGQTVTMGEDAVFSLATNGPTSGFQWQVTQNNGASWSNVAANEYYSGVTTNALQITNVPLEMNGYRYRCVVSGSCGVQYSSIAVLTVQLPVNYYEIALASNTEQGGSTEGAGAYESGTQCTVTATPTTGYEFVNWTEGGTEVSQDASYTFTVENNRDLVANFTLQEISIVTNAVPLDGGAINGGGSYLYGNHVLLTAIPSTGYVFDNWTENGEVVSTNQSISFTAQIDRTLEANFSVLQVNISAIPLPASNGSVEGAGVFPYGTPVMLVAYAVEGYELANWTEDGIVVSTSDTLSFMAKTDRNLEAHFIVQSLNITAAADPEGSGIVTGAGTYNYGDPVVLTAIPQGDFEFYNWTEDGEEVSTDMTFSFTANANRNLVAHFYRTITIVAVVNPEEGGVVNGSGTYNYLDPITLTATPITGYTFVNWMENDTVFSTQNTISFTALVDRSFVANFEIIQVNITAVANPEEGGNVIGMGLYDYGEQVVLIANPASGYEFSSWTENGTAVSTDAIYVFTARFDRSLVAEFSMVTYQVTTTANPSNGGQVTGDGVYHYGDECTLTATPDSRYYFVNWTVNDTVVSTNSEYSFNVTNNVTVVANFECALTIGDFSYMSPVNEFVNRYSDIDFVWDAVSNANSYDLYCWQGEGGRPSVPTVAGLASTSYHFAGLQNNTTYHWCVVAKNDCIEQESPIRSFSCQLTPMLAVLPVGSLDFREVEIGQTRTKTLSISGTALSENISYSYLDNAYGQDAAYFTITPSSNWNPTSGGSLQVTFAPDATKLYYNAAIKVMSGTLIDTIYFTGSLANRYVFSTEVEGEIFSANDDITIAGHVEDILGNSVPSLNVDVYLIVMGSRITLPTVSDANGDYSVVYSPRYSEAGYYKVGSCEKGKYSNSEHDSFDIPGMGRTSSDFIIWKVPQNNSITGTIGIRNRSRIPLGNVQISSISLPDGCTVEFTGTSLGSLETGEFHYIVSGTELSTESDYEEATFLITSDAGISMNLTCYYYCYRGRGELDVYPYSVATTMARNRQKMLSFQITNNGIGETGPITIDLPDVDWMSVLGGNTLESLPVGDSCAFTIKLAPDDNVSLNQYTGNIAVNCANGNGITIPYQLEATADSTGTLVVDVTDDYTWNTNDGNGSHLVGANVTIKGFYSLTTVAQGVTGEDGHFVASDLPEGYYYLTVQAPNHKEYNNGIIYIEAGMMHWKEVYLQFQAISYSWVVKPTEIPDVYKYELVTEIKTNVPVPVVVMDYPKVMDTLDYGDSLQFDITLTNYGLIDAYEALIVPPTQMEEYDFYPLFDFIDTLHALTSVTIPCTMTRTQRSRADNNSECQHGYWSRQDFWYCNHNKVWELHKDSVYMWNNCLENTPPKPHPHDTTNNQVHNNPPIVWPWHWPDSIPQILPPIPPVHLPHIPPLPGFTTNDPHNNVEYVTQTSDEDCYPCWKVWATILINVTVPVLSGYLVCFMDAGLEETVNYFTSIDKDPELMECVTVASLDLIGGSYGGVIYEIYSFVTQVEEVLQKIHNCVRYRNDDLAPEVGVALDQLEHSKNYYQFLLDEMTNVFQEEEWMHEANLFGFFADFRSVIDTSNNMISPQAVQQLKETCEMSYVNDSIIQCFADRWNRSVQYWNEGYFTIADLPVGYDTNFIQKDTIMMVLAREAIEAAEAYGFNNIQEMLESSIRVLKSVAREHTNDVCSKVSVSFKQYQTMTREAFDGTLKIYNGHTTDAMENIDVDIVIKDTNGVDKTNLFQINVVSLDQISGIDGSGILDAQQEGIIQFQMIPTIAAAPDSAMIYSFGGSFTFLDPFSGEIMTKSMGPVELTVNPSPNLHVDYFVQRNIISDDPLTDTIEDAEPAEIAMMIRNVGAGDANNVYLESSQPTIVDNENGLLIQFDMVSAAMNGEQRPLSLTDIPYGTIQSHTAGIAEWYFTSSLMGRIIHSTPHVIHSSSYGNPDLSLVTELNSHELIKAIRAYGSLDDGINDFFVNETIDFNHTPDKIYFSHGGTANVSKILIASTEGVLSDENNTVLLNVIPVNAGWNYACVDDPGQGLYEIISCTRNDGQQIPLNNVWISHVTMFDDDAPIHENKLHIVDTVMAIQPVSYTLVFRDITSSQTIQVTSLEQGWNWWSTYIEQEGIDGLSMLKNSLDGLGIRIQGKNASIDYYAYQGQDYWYGNLDAIDNEQMFKIRTSSACEVEISGEVALAYNHPITITNGWNWIGYPISQCTSIDVALNDFTPEDNDVIKGRNSSATFVSSGNYSLWYGTLQTLEPGQGYMYKSNHSEGKTLVFQTGRSVIHPNITPDDNVFVPADAEYADNMLITAVIELDGEELRSEEYEVAAFVGDECRGSVKLMYIEPLDRYVAFLLVFGDRAESMYFVLTDGLEMSRSKERCTYMADATIGMVADPITLHFNALGLEDDLLLPVHIYPNPSKGIFNVEGVGIKKVEVVDAFGQVILSEEVRNDNLQINLSDKAAGAYLLRVVTDRGVATKKLVLVK